MYHLHFPELPLTACTERRRFTGSTLEKRSVLINSTSIRSSYDLPELKRRELCNPLGWCGSLTAIMTAFGTTTTAYARPFSMVSIHNAAV